MTSTSTYCCFFCGQSSENPVSLSDSCKCGKSYDLVLQKFPANISSYQIERPLSRGFYGATYVVMKGSLRRKKVLKVIPVSFYDDRETTIEQETQNHAAAAEGAEFIVEISDDPFRESINFDGSTVECFCIEMEYVDGFVLSEICSGKRELSTEAAVQISCDLISILAELQQRQLNHNDLHDGNIVIEQLKSNTFRAESIDRSIRAKAIDLGSVDSQRREGPDYRSDVQWISEHLLTFSNILSDQNPGNSDLRARVAFSLRQRALELKAPQAHQSDQPLEDIIRSIKNSYQSARQKVNRRWNTPLHLGSFSSHKNAQTLESWHVPELMVDPAEQWLSGLHTGGPVVVTGMRGCGKTMLLRSLELHARIKSAEQKSEANGNLRSLIAKDGYIGVFASARHLGRSMTDASANVDQTTDVSQIFARLFLVYAMNICDALTHLEEVSPGSVHENVASNLASIVFGQISKSNPLPSDATLYDLQTNLIKDAELMSSSGASVELVAEPWNAFVLLAKSVQASLRDWGSPQIVFLLDDVSTRYLTRRQIELVVSTLLVQDPSCAFKITSESQTFFLSIKSPAQINQASDERDYSSFDLGSKVLEKLKDRQSGGRFLEQILSRRMKAMGGELAHLSPREILGETALIQIARDICSAHAAGSKAEEFYHGFSALQGVCIGDLGSIIALYQEIYGQAAANSLPVSVKSQHDVFQAFCSNQLFQLNNRDGKQKTDLSLKRVALEFAQASHDEMIDSFRNGNDRLRQITSIHVTLEEGNSEQINKLLELVDAGIFALHPRKMSPRNKSKYGDPLQQFHLSFRKILGISKLIGLSDRDRFELNGGQLLDWLSGEGGQEVLRANTRKFGSTEDAAATTFEEFVEPAEDVVEVQVQPQLPLVVPEKTLAPASQPLHLPRVKQIPVSDAPQVDNLFVSLGFEERCRESAKRLARQVKPSCIIAVEYNIAGDFEQTRSLAEEIGASIDVVKFEHLMSDEFEFPPGTSLIDASGLTKPAIYRLVKLGYKVDGRVLAAVTEPEEYRPTEADLDKAIGDGLDFSGDEGVEKLANILNGDTLPYALDVIDQLNSDPSRTTKLCAFGSAKHGRLIHLVEVADYDDIDVLIPAGESRRLSVARKAASIATGGGELGSIVEYQADDAEALLRIIFENHFSAYAQFNSNFELALTGGKLEAILSGVAGAVLPINRVLYVKPSDFDPINFSDGVGQTRVFEVNR